MRKRGRHLIVEYLCTTQRNECDDHVKPSTKKTPDRIHAYVRGIR